ncbi:uncharacterized protein LOC123292680 [Chrysoperla carnea]|uniref:uncharacterized protein LOC123292680 n=1 Tax=Chrysoperla carnea TaxID=189513 RepID=UPI001D08939F|nr:uncharacterized protein LOC123292680 [Chrysoperla carnea]
MNENNNETNSVAQFIENPLLEINYKQNFPKGGSSHMSKQQTSLYQENERLLSSSYKSKEEFTREYKKLYCENLKAKEFYLLVLIKVAKAISDNNVANLKKLSKFIGYVNSVENQATLRDYYNDVKNPIQKTNLVILACQHNKVTILEYLFDNSSNILNSLSVDIGRNITLPNDKDELGHNAIYYAIRSGNIELLDTLINKWPGNYFDINFNELDEIISQPYEELKLKNIPLSEEIEIFIYNKLINLRFFSNVPEQKCNEEGNVNNIIERIDLVLQNIALLKEEFSNREQVNQKFLFIAKFIAQNIHILKRQLKSTYDRLPWEEIEFCLVIFVSSRTNRKEINLFYDATLNKNKLLNHLENFAKRLNDEKAIIEHVDVNLLNVIPNIKREQVIMEIVNNYPQFGELYSDYKKIRDLYSLEKISDYIKLALSADPKQKDGQLIITRALQMIGENLKNTLESPKLSSDTSELLLLSFPNNTRKVIIGLRNSLSHAYSLFKRTEIEENTDVIFFIGIQNDKNKKLISIIELLVLDIMSILGQSNKYLKNNLNFLDDYSPLLTGKSLRNHLAHDNVLFDILLSDLSMAIILNANKLISENIIKNKKKLGKLVTDDPSQLKNKYEKNLITIANQEKMFTALEEGNFEDLKNCLRKGADINARSISSWTTLHFAAKSPSLKIIKYIFDQNINANVKDMNGQNPLHIAAAYGRESIVEFFLREVGLCIDDQDDSGKTPLHIAAKNGHKDAVKSLLKNNANTDIKDIHGFPPLHYAIKNNHIDVAKILLEKETNVDINQVKGGFTSLHIAAENGHVELVNFLLKSRANVNVKTDQGTIPLHLAALNGYLEIVNALIFKGANVNTKTIDGCSPLHYAIENGHEEIANILLKHGANVNVVDKVYNNTPLHYAAKYGHENIVKLLLENKANASIPTVHGITPLHFAIRGGHLKIVATLLEYGVNIHDKDFKSTSPLHQAAQEGHKDIIELLIRNGAKVRTQDIMGNTPLHAAAEFGRTNIIELLIKNKAEVDARNYDGITRLHLGALNKQEDAIIFLIKNKAEINTKNNYGITPLHAAINGGYKNIVIFLIKHKAKINVKDISGNTPLLVAVEAGHQEIVEILIENGADINISNNKNLTPLFSAIKHNRKRIVEVLIENGANINMEVGESLSLAVRAGYREIVEILLQNAAFINIKYPEDVTPLHLATQRNHKEIVNLLIMKGFDVDAMNIHKLTALHLAAQEGHAVVAKILIAKGANVNVANVENTSLHLAAMHGHVNIIKILLSNGAKIDVKDNQNRTPLELAVYHSQLDVVKMLLRHKKVDINAKGKDDWTLLHIASQASNLEMVKFLVNKGSNINARTMSGLKPIHFSAREGNKDTVEFFLSKGLSINELGSTNQTLLHYATKKTQFEVVKYLLTQEAEVNAKDDNDSTPLHIAATVNNKDIIEILLENGAIYNHINKLSKMPLEIAEKKGIISLLTLTEKLFESIKRNSSLEVENDIKAGAFVNAKHTKLGTSLHYAAWKGYDKIVKILLQNKANPNIVGSKGFTPMHYATKFSHLKIVKYLLTYGAVYNAMSDSGKTPQDFAVDRNINSLLKLIRESFKKVKEDNDQVINDLNKIQDNETVKAVMGSCDNQNKTLIVVAIHCNFSKVEQLKQISQSGISTEILTGSMLLDQGHYQNALNIFRNAFERRKEILGSDNPGTLDIQAKIAMVLYKQGKYQEALTMYEEIFQKQKETLGLNHEDTLSTRSVIALVLYRQENNERAFNIYQDVYQKQKETLGSNHPDTLNTMFHMALVLERLGKYEEALNINKAVFEKRKETLGSNNLATVSAKNNIALVLASQKKYEEALKLYKEVFEKKKKILGINHTDTLRTLHNIAGIHFSQKNYSEALKGFQEVLNIQKVALLPNHPEALTTEYNIANVLLLQGKYISALKTFTEIHDKMITVFGPHHPRVMDILTKIKIINAGLRFQGSGLSEVLQNHQKEILLLNIAANEGDVQTVQRLLNDGANVNDKDVDGRTPLHFAVSNGHINVVNMLLQNGAVVTEATKKGNTPLHTATSKGYKEIIEVLLQHISRNRDILNDFIDAKTTSSGTTSLHIAAKSGFLEIIKSLLKHGAIYNSKNKKGEVPVDVSTDQKTINLLKLIENLFRDVKNGNLGTISKLRSIKPDEFLALTSARNNQGNTLLQVAIFNKHNAIAGEILKMLMTN